jgi:NAD(P)-dependent dehydrogenase (short-subunit alcohol dehydrogenase family)
MQKLCEGRVAIVTGAGRGVGRDYALMLARHGARVVVNDLGADATGRGVDASPAQQVVDEIRAAGGEAVVNGADVSDWTQAKAMVDQAVETFGGLDVLINNAGILRDRMLINMSEEDWDSVIKVHLKGTFAPSRHAAAYWRSRKKEGKTNDARIINTTSASGLFGIVGQANYGSAKAGIAGFTVIVAREMHSAGYGVTVNAIAPRANTRLTEGLLNYTEEQIERRKPSWISPLITWLASPESRDITGRVFEAWGYGYSVAENWQHGPIMEAVEDPHAVGAQLRQILEQARQNAGIERDTWMNP